MLSASFLRQLEQLPRLSRLLFCACLTQRMMPNFQLFALSSGFAPENILQKYLDLFWEYLSYRGAKINFAIQYENFEQYIPDVQNFDMFGVYPAIDCCVSLELLFNGILSADSDEAAHASQISMGSIVKFLEMQFADSLSDEQLAQQPLVQAELKFQERCYHLACNFEQKPVYIKEVKHFARNEDVSNLGICLQDDEPA
ncbi:MAG: hypothetical protein CENE_00825 [Candidatus Celerinatantimonas neptuna]|nr:MAG: hypothetical protein CENE_00825 [Candidatus Celerinatantimonas neptuna]